MKKKEELRVYKGGKKLSSLGQEGKSISTGKLTGEFPRFYKNCAARMIRTKNINFWTRTREIIESHLHCAWTSHRWNMEFRVVYKRQLRVLTLYTVSTRIQFTTFSTSHQIPRESGSRHKTLRLSSPLFASFTRMQGPVMTLSRFIF